MMEEERGEILKEGEYFRWWGTKEGKRKLFKISILAIGVGAFLVLWEVLIWMGVSQRALANPRWLFWVRIIIIGHLLVLGPILVYAMRPETWDRLARIYENGLSTPLHPYISYSEIDKIAYGRTPRGAKFIKVLSRQREDPVLHPIQPSNSLMINEVRFKDNFFEAAKKALKQNCPDVSWEEMEWREWEERGWK